MNYSPVSTAIKTLEKLGYKYNGGELWRPLLGKAPAFVTDEIKLPVRWLRKKGIKLAVGDEWVSDMFSLSKISKHNVDDFNNDHSGQSITSFTDRKNTGEQPVADCVPVEWSTAENHGNYSNAHSLPWGNVDGRLISLISIQSWKPDAKALMEIYLAEQGDEKVIDPPNVFDSGNYNNGCECQLFGVKAKDMNKKELITFIGMLDNLTTNQLKVIYG